MDSEWLVTFFDEFAFAKFMNRYTGMLKQRIAYQIEQHLRFLGLNSVAYGSARALGQGLYELKVSIRPEVEIRVFFAVGEDRTIIVLSVYDKKSNDSKNWQSQQIQRARSILKTLDAE